MMIKPIQVTTVIIDKTLHAAHHPVAGALCHAADSIENSNQWLPERLLPYRHSWRAVAIASAPMGLIASRCGDI
jgi:hypothetical protein